MILSRSLPEKSRLFIGIVLIFGAAVIARNASGQTLGEALDATNLTWSTSGASGGNPWSVTSSSPHKGTSAAASGFLSRSSATSTLQTTLVGPGTLTFWWKNPSANKLAFMIDTNTLTWFGGPYLDWHSATYYLGSGSQTFKWVFSVLSTFGGSSANVDDVSYTPGATGPIITAVPSSQSQIPGLDATFSVEAGGTPPLAYQWQFNGQPIQGATSNAFTIHSIQSADLGNYSVTITNTVGSTSSPNASLEFGEITAWGSPAYGATIVPPGATNISELRAGDYYNIVLRRDRSTLGWGFNVQGETTPPADLTNAIAFAAGSGHVLALRNDGTVAAWGQNGEGEANVPAGLSNVVAVAAGDFFSLALRSDGTVAAWGQNTSGQTNEPLGLSNVVAIAAGSFLSLALTADGHVVEWSGQAAPAGVSNIIAITAGGNHYVALREDGTVLCWGQNTYGETNVPAGLGNVVAISAGAFHTLALRADGSLVAWGTSTSGVTNIPAALSNAIDISAGAFHNLVRAGDGPPTVTATIVDFGIFSDGFHVLIPSRNGTVYALQYKTALEEFNWTSLPLVAGNGTNLVLIDPNATGASRFYRVLRW